MWGATSLALVMMLGCGSPSALDGMPTRPPTFLNATTRDLSLTVMAWASELPCEAENEIMAAEVGDLKGFGAPVTVQLGFTAWTTLWPDTDTDAPSCGGAWIVGNDFAAQFIHWDIRELGQPGSRELGRSGEGGVYGGAVYAELFGTEVRLALGRGMTATDWDELRP